MGGDEPSLIPSCPQAGHGRLLTDEDVTSDTAADIKVPSVDVSVPRHATRALIALTCIILVVWFLALSLGCDSPGLCNRSTSQAASEGDLQKRVNDNNWSPISQVN